MTNLTVHGGGNWRRLDYYLLFFDPNQAHADFTAMTAVTTDLTGGELKFDAALGQNVSAMNVTITEVLQTNTNQWFWEIPTELISTYHDAPQITMTIEDYPVICDTDCDFEVD